MGIMGSERSGLTRRNFLMGAGAAGATALMGTALAACSPNTGANAAAGAAGEENVQVVDEVTQRLLDRGISGANLPDAAPILPAGVPEAWDDEADVIVVGLGGGGLVACGYLAEQGNAVIGIDKDMRVGGASRHAGGAVNILGGTKEQTELGFPGRFDGDLNAAINFARSTSQFSANERLLRTIFSNCAEGYEWILDQDGMTLRCLGMLWTDENVANGTQSHVMGMNNTINALEQAAINHGADIRCQTEAKKFVMDGERVVGVVVSDPEGNEKYYKARKGLVLTAGGMGMNKDLIKAYIPSAAEGAVQGGPMPSHTGDVFRMGLGVGADFAGYDSWCCWEAGIDESTAGGDGQFWHYFWHGERQLFHNPWLLIDKFGNRQPYFAAMQPNYMEQAPLNIMGDLATVASWMSAVGHKVYNICDSKYPEEVFKKVTTNLSGVWADTCRIPITDSSTLLEDAAGLVSGDWQKEVEEAVARGAVKKADTLEELAEMLLLDPAVVKKAVEDYNAVCAKGVDDELATPYDPSWLSPIDTPPYYAAIVGGQIGKTLCGLRVNDKLQVSTENGKAIPGLYAGFSTFGGFGGESNFGGFWNGGTYLGGIGSTLVCGYTAAKLLNENE